MTAPTVDAHVILGFPYLHWSHGERVRPVEDEELRTFHAAVKDADKHDGYRLGGRWES